MNGCPNSSPCHVQAHNRMAKAVPNQGIKMLLAGRLVLLHFKWLSRVRMTYVSKYTRSSVLDTPCRAPGKTCRE